jgi:hypothetical protein
MELLWLVERFFALLLNGGKEHDYQQNEREHQQGSTKWPRDQYRQVSLGECRTATGKDAKHRTEHSAADDRRNDALPILSGRHQTSDGL